MASSHPGDDGRETDSQLINLSEADSDEIEALLDMDSDTRDRVHQIIYYLLDEGHEDSLTDAKRSALQWVAQNRIYDPLYLPGENDPTFY